LDQFSRCNRDKFTIGAEFDGIHCILEVNAVEDDVAGGIDEVAAVVLVDSKEESSVGGGGNAADVGGGLEWEGYGLGFYEVGDRDSVADW
jgi:hypothetical protein